MAITDKLKSQSLNSKQLYDYVIQNEPLLRTQMRSVSEFNVLKDYATLRYQSDSLGGQFAKDNMVKIDAMFSNYDKMDKTEFKNYWNAYTNDTAKQFKYATNALSVTDTGLMESWNGIDDNSALKRSYNYDLADEEDVWRQAYGFAPKAIDSDIKRLSQNGFAASKFYTNDDNGLILNDLYSYDMNDAEDELNYLLGRTPKSFKYDSTDEDKARERDGLIPLAAESYINNTKQFAAEYEEYSAKMQDYANKKYEYDNLPWLTKLFTAAPTNPYADGEPATIAKIKQYKQLQKAEQDLAAVETNDFTRPKKTDTESDAPFFAFDDTLPFNVEEFAADEDTVSGKNKAVIRELGASFLKNTASLSGVSAITNSMIDSAVQDADNQDVIANLKETGEYDDIMRQQRETAQKVSDTLKNSYSKENYDFVMGSADYVNSLDISGNKKEIGALAVKALNASAAPELNAITGLAKLVPDSSMVGANPANALLAFDPTIKNIKSQLDALGWNGEATSDNAEIQDLLNQAEYRTMQLRKDNVDAYREQLKTMPAWLVALSNGMAGGVESFSNSIETVALELGKLNFSNKDLTGVLDDRASQIAMESMNKDIIARNNAAMGAGASELTNTIYDVAKVGTEMGISLAAGSALSSVVGGGAAAAESATALNGWKAVASKVLTIRPQAVPLFVSTVGHELMQGEIEGRTDAEKWLQALPSAYFQTIIEQGTGFFSGRSAPITTLIKNGTKGAAKKTLANVSVSLLENTLGEAIEENLQDITSEFFRDIMWSDDYKANYLDWEQIGQTTKTTMSVGLLMSLFGLPGGVGNVNIARNAENSFNAVVDAYTSGDAAAFETAMGELKTNYGKGIELMHEQAENGTLNQIIESYAMDADTGAALSEMKTAIQSSLDIRAQKESGVDIAQSVVDIADARANQAIQRVQVGTLGRSMAPATLYDQISSSEELTKMAYSGGIVSNLISQNKSVLTDAQIETLRNIQFAAQSNPYVGVVYSETTTPETLEKDVTKYTEKSQTAQAELKMLNDTYMREIEDAYNESTAIGKAKYNEFVQSGIIKKLQKAYKSVDLYKSRLNESIGKRGGFAAQQALIAAFSGKPISSPVSQSAALTSTEVQSQGLRATQAENDVATMSDRAIPMNGSADAIIGSANSISELAQTAQTRQDNGKIAEVLTSVERSKPTLGEQIKATYDFAKRKFVDSGAAIGSIAKKLGDNLMYPLYNNAKQAKHAAQYMIGGEQIDMNYNVVGKSLIDVFAYARAQGDEYTNRFFSYLYHMHNVDRMAQGKPVFGESVTAEMSQAEAAKLEQENPEFATMAQDVYKYNDNLLQWRVDSKRITQEQADEMRAMYPHYVPTYRKMPKTAGATAVGGRLSVADTLKEAKGSNLDLMPIDESMARMTMQVVEMSKANVLGNRLLEQVLANQDKTGEFVGSVTIEGDRYDIDTEEGHTNDSAKNTVRIYRGGEVATLKVSPSMYEAFKDLSVSTEEANMIMRAAHGLNSTFKKLVTGYNPIFSARNFLRDLQDAGLNTKDMPGFMANFPLAYKEIATNGEYWKLYQAAGGLGSSFFDYDKGLKLEKDSAVRRYTLGVVENVNMAIEQAPRLAEFMATIKKGGTSYENITQAMYNAAEVTVNFGRSGSWGRVINKTFVPFFNPSVQGASKFIRRFTENKGVGEWSVLVVRAVALGMLPSLLNNLLYSDDDEYKNINNRDKDKNYLFKMGDGIWAKVPKGRVLSLISGITNRVTGEYGEDDFAGFIELAKEQIAPISPFESNILAPFDAIANNKTWYGSDIESQYLRDNYASGQRYDESTDAFSKWLGGVTNFSPKKINYLIDAYTGVIGDVLLPMTSPKAEAGGIAAPFVSAFTLDTKVSNKLSTKFYDNAEKTTQDMNSGDTAKAAKAKADNKIIQKYSDDISELSKLIRQAQNSDKPNDEKLTIVRDLKATIAGLQKSALDILK